MTPLDFATSTKLFFPMCKYYMAKRGMSKRVRAIEEITSHDLTMSLRGLLNDSDESIVLDSIFSCLPWVSLPSI